ncbi:MAG TPA: hypothetical protein VGM43_04525 [Bryobacteraceae bacterium]
MADVQITDELGQPLSSVKIDLTHPSSLITYLKGELLHLAVFPDFLKCKDQLLSQAAPKPVTLQAKFGHQFQLGNTNPEIDITPSAQAGIHVNATPGCNLFEDESFRVPTTVPTQTGYVGLEFSGGLSLGATETQSALSFGFTKSTAITLACYKAFPLGTGEPTLLQALADAMSAFVIPADIGDLKALGLHDVACAAGTGSFQISSGISVTAAPNPLASVDLPLGAGSLSVKTGATAGFTADVTVTGSWQVRVERAQPQMIKLSFAQQRGTTLTADWSASAGVTAKLGSIDLTTAILGAISTDPVKDQAIFSDLTSDECQTLTSAIKGSLNHSLQASIDAALSSLTENDAAFQYEIHLDELTPETSNAIHRALHGDLTLLTALEPDAADDGMIAPGIRVLNSVLTQIHKRGLTINLNLLGIVNFTSVAEFVRNSETVVDSASGAVTIKNTLSGTRISAIANPLDRDEALRKAIFDSVLVTTTYRAAQAIAPPAMACEHVHFAFHQKTNHATFHDYLTWFMALQLMDAGERDTTLHTFADGGPSTCVLRTAFNDHDCTALFLKDGQPRNLTEYEDIGRRTLRALLNPSDAVDAVRYRLIDDGLWQQALRTGSNPSLGPLVGLSTNDPRVSVLIADILVIREWAGAMSDVSELVARHRGLVDSGAAAAQQSRDALQKKLSEVVHASTMRFDKPFGMVALFRAAGSPPAAYGRAVMKPLTVERGRLAQTLTASQSS